MKLISIIIPVYNEEKNVPLLYGKLHRVFQALSSQYNFELIFVNDGSRDKSAEEIEKLAGIDTNVHLVDFSRNFGKEMATTAGIHHCNGDACVMIDADLQHPVELIPEFLKKWEEGMEVVVGVRKRSRDEGLVKRLGSAVFYKIINRIAEVKVVPNATDFRLMDRVVIDEFNRFTEKSRMTRALIDWLGFRREYIYFQSNERMHGNAGYSFAKLFRLAMASFVGLSLFPLKIAGYLGLVTVFLSGIFGLFILVGDYVFHKIVFSGPAVLLVASLFLIGIVLSCLGLIALYIANIHGEVTNRPMYVIRRRKI